MANKTIPFVILETQLEHTKPYVTPTFGIAKEELLHKILLKKLAEFVSIRTDIDKITCISDINSFWKKNYGNINTKIFSWEAIAVINGIWENICFSDIELFNYLMEEKANDLYLSSDSENSQHTLVSIVLNETDDDVDSNVDVDAGELDMERIINKIELFKDNLC